MDKFTHEQNLVLTGFTGILCVDKDVFMEDIAQRLGRPLDQETDTPDTIYNLYKDDFMFLIGASDVHTE